MVDGRVVAVIDLDSPVKARFDAEDAAGIELWPRSLVGRLSVNLVNTWFYFVNLLLCGVVAFWY
jgi:hypothetical protein